MRFRTAILTALVLLTTLTPAAQHVAAQDNGLTLSLTANVNKARVGDYVAFTVQFENPGPDSIAGVMISLGLPDALDARAVNCPGEPPDAVTSCILGDVAAGSVTEVLFIVQVGSKATNGPVTAWAAGTDGTMLATDDLPPLKIVGKPRSRR